jgi:hypothetical protein
LGTKRHHLAKGFVSFLTLLAIIIFQTPTIFAEPLSAASVKPGLEKFAVVLPDGLWVVKNGNVSHIADGWIVQAAWSQDGRYLAYLTAVPRSSDGFKTQILDMQTGKSEELLSGHSLKWAPNVNVLALQSDGTLNLYDFRGVSADRHLNQMLGIDNYTFSSYGHELLLGSNADLRPDGWTHAIIYKSRLMKHLPPTRPQQFFVIPKEISMASLPGNIHSWGRVLPVRAIHVGDMLYNQDDTWIGFVASPTAGISVDHNALCVIRNKSGVWRPIGNIAGYYTGYWRFSPNGRQVGFIAGDERWSYRHKQAVTTTLVDGKSIIWTPAGSADDSFAWASDSMLIVSRAKEQPAPPHGPYIVPLANLYGIDLLHKQQHKLTTPPGGYGDYRPQVHSGWLIWTRANRERGDIWIADKSGKNAEILVRNTGGNRQRESIIVFPTRWMDGRSHKLGR